MNRLTTIASNTIFQLIARVASSGASFLITLFIARSFGINAYGDYAKITGFVTLFYLLIDFGLNAIFLQEPDSRVRFKDLLVTRLLFSIGCIVLVSLITFFLPYNPITQIGFSPLVRLGIIVFSLTFITEGITYTATAVFQRDLRYENFMIATIIGSLFTLLFVVLAVLISKSLLVILGSFFLGGIIESGTAFYLTKEPLWTLRIDGAFIRRLIRTTFPIALTLVFNLIYFRVDMFLLALLKPSSDVAIYDISYKFFDFLIALPLFLSNALYPQLLVDEGKGSNQKRKVYTYIGIFAGFSLLVATPFWLAAPLLQWIKPEFLAAAVPLRLLLLSLPVFFITSILQWILIAKKKQTFLAVVYGGATVVNIILNMIFIPQYSYIASSIITGVSEFLVLMVLWLKLFPQL